MKQQLRLAIGSSSVLVLLLLAALVWPLPRRHQRPSPRTSDSQRSVYGVSTSWFSATSMRNHFPERSHSSPATDALGISRRRA